MAGDRPGQENGRGAGPVPAAAEASGAGGPGNPELLRRVAGRNAERPADYGLACATMRTALGLLVALALCATGCSSSEQALSDVAATASAAVSASTAAPTPTLTLVPGATASVPPQAEPTGATASSSARTGSPSARATSAPQPSARSASPTAPAAPTSSPTQEPEDPLASRSPLEAAPSPGQPTCDPRALTVTDAGRSYTLSAVQSLFTIRTSGPDCQLEGYPGIALRDAQGEPLEVEVRHGGYGLPAGAPAATTLSRGTSVSFFVATAREQGCEPAASLTVTLPGTARPLTTATTTEVCDGSVGITPVRRETDDE